MIKGEMFEVLSTLKPGDTVILYSSSSGEWRHRKKANDKVVPIVKVGRTLLHVQTHDWGDPSKFRMDTGRLHDNGSSPNLWITTPELADREQRRDEAYDTLKELAGLEWNWRVHAPSALLIELAEVARKYTEQS